MTSSATIVQRGNSYVVQHGTDAGLFVQFYMEALQDPEASEREGRPIFIDREFIKIIPVGDKNTVVCEPVSDEHKYRWPQQYAQFKNQQEQVTEGTPLDQWPPLTKSQVLTFKAANVHTVEQLAEVSDTNLPNLGMGSRDLREKAKIYLASAKDGAIPLAAQNRIAELEKQLEAMKNQLDGLGSEVVAKKRGRPAKTEETEE